MSEKRIRGKELSSFILRRIIGILGILLPLICVLGGLAFGGLGMQPSISHYYHTNMRDFLIALLGCTALFLFSYKGYTRVDDLISWIIGLAGAGIAVFPCPSSDPGVTRLGILQVPAATAGLFHLVFTGAFFLLLAVNSLFLFTKSQDQPMTARKRIRNAIYIGCGIVILVSLGIIFIIYLVAPRVIEGSSIGLLFETIMLWAFGFSWLVKGESFTFLKDR